MILNLSFSLKRERPYTKALFGCKEKRMEGKKKSISDKKENAYINTLLSNTGINERF